jgi:tRNA(fMet)-specific endonuclease VapC
MTASYLLDTNIISHLMKNPTGSIAQRLRHNAQSMPRTDGTPPVCTSVIVQCELLYGIGKNPSPKLQTAYDITMRSIPVLALAPDVSQHYSQLRVALEAQGTPIGPNDTLIAAHALALG